HRKKAKALAPARGSGNWPTTKPAIADIQEAKAGGTDYTGRNVVMRGEYVATRRSRLDFRQRCFEIGSNMI
ncbi:MAG: hypothetical protein KAU58_06325, partial [Candidatus Omnitrophica bacterium]|nr:hypothetical protein [Candidatus Omnitrophota bacterium]